MRFSKAKGLWLEYEASTEALRHLGYYLDQYIRIILIVNMS